MSSKIVQKFNDDDDGKMEKNLVNLREKWVLKNEEREENLTLANLRHEWIVEALEMLFDERDKEKLAQRERENLIKILEGENGENKGNI